MSHQIWMRKNASISIAPVHVRTSYDFNNHIKVGVGVGEGEGGEGEEKKKDKNTVVGVCRMEGVGVEYIRHATALSETGNTESNQPISPQNALKNIVHTMADFLNKLFFISPPSWGHREREREGCGGGRGGRGVGLALSWENDFIF